MKKLLLILSVTGFSVLGKAQINALPTNQNLTCRNEKPNVSIEYVERNDTCSIQAAELKKEEMKPESKSKKNILKKIFSGYAGVDFSGAWGLMSKN